MPLGKFIYFLSPSVDGGGEGGRGAVKPPIWSSFFPIHYDVNSRIS